MLLGRRYLKNHTWLLRVTETNLSFYLTFGCRFTQYRLVFCSIPCSFVCELIIYDVMFVLLLVLGYIIINFTTRKSIHKRQSLYKVSAQ